MTKNYPAGTCAAIHWVFSFFSWITIYTWEDPEAGAGGRDPLENHKLLYVSLEILVRTPFELQFDPVWHYEICWRLKKVFRTPFSAQRNFLDLCMIRFIIMRVWAVNPITTAADDKFFNIFPRFWKNKVWYFIRIVCQQMILMKYHALFVIFEKAAKFEIVVCCKL